MYRYQNKWKSFPEINTMIDQQHLIYILFSVIIGVYVVIE